MNRNYAKLTDEQIKFAENYLIINGVLVTNPTEQTYISEGWKRYVDVKPEYREGYYYVQDGYEQTDVEIRVLYKYVQNPKVYRRFSILKLEIELLKRNLLDKLDKFLDDTYITGSKYNIRRFYETANDIAEDHVMFEAYFSQAKNALGISDEEAEEILSLSVEDLA